MNPQSLTELRAGGCGKAEKDLNGILRGVGEGVMSELVQAPISKLAAINPGRESLELKSNDEVSFIPMGDLTESGRWIGSQTREYGLVRNGFTFFREGDVLFAKITPCMENGKGCLVGKLANNTGFGSTEFHVLRAKDQSDSGYIHQWLQYPSLRRSASNVMVGSAGQQRVPTKFFDEYQVPFFPKPEQAKIAEVLSTVDRAIEQTEALIAKQQRIKAGLLQDLLTRGIDEHGNLRSEATHAFKDSPLGRIPVEWEVKSIESNLERIIDYRGRTPIKTDSGVPLLTAKNVRDGYLSEEPHEYIAADRFDSWMTRGIPASGDVMISTEAPMGNVARIPEYRIALAQRLITLQPIREELSNDFLFWLLHWKRTLERLEILTSGSTVTGIKQSVFRKVDFAFPELDEQTRIACILEADKQSRDDNGRQLSKLRSLKTALMQDLLTGKKRVTPLLDNPPKEIHAAP